MEAIVNYFASMDLNIETFLKATGMLIAALFVLALVGRFVFGKKSPLLRAVSSAIGILFIYALTIVLGGLGEEFQKFIAPLPFVTIANEQMVLFNFQADYTVVTTQILSMIILSFLMNLADGWLPTGKNVFIWILFRCLAVALGLAEHFLQGRGAYRVHGGGFAGTIQAFVPFGLLDSFVAGMDGALGAGACHVLSIRPQGGVEMEVEV